MKKVVAAIIAVIIIASAWIAAFTHINAPTEESEAVKYITLAEKQCAAAAYGSAIRLYQRAISTEDSVDLRLKLAETWRLYGNDAAFRNELKELIRAYPKEPRGYELLTEYYFGGSELSKCCDVIHSAKAAGVESERLDEVYRKSAYRYDILERKFDSAGAFVGGFAIVQREGKVFIINSELKDINNNGFDFADVFFGSSAAVRTEGDCYFIDKSGGKYMVVDENYTCLRSYSEGMAVVKRDGVFGYINIFGEWVFGEYDFASSFSCGIAAVSDEEGWYFIDSDGKSLSNVRYDSVKLDDNNTIGGGEFCFVEEEGCWYIVDMKSGKAGRTKFEDARAPTDDNIAAVRQDGMWGFTDKSGRLRIMPRFEDATSFLCGLAAVKQGGVWGYIDQEGETVINFVYEDAKQFSDNGIAPVKIDGKWKYIKLKYRENLR